MASLDVFKADAFGVLSLTTAMNKMPYVPARLGASGLFRKEGIRTTSVMVEEQNNKLMVVPNVARGSSPNAMSGAKRSARTFQICHLPLAANVMADDVQNVRSFGSETETQTVAEIVNDKIAQMRRNFEATHEFHRIGAIQGLLLDADNATTIYDWYSEFGITQETANIDTDTPATNNNEIRLACQKAKRLISDNLGMETFTGIRAICGANVFDKLLVAGEVVRSHMNQKSEVLRSNYAYDEFDYAGVTFEEYRGSIPIAGTPTPFFPNDTIIFYPTGTQDVFVELYGPANFAETVNTKGLPVYVKQERMKFDLGIELFGQSNPLIMCTRPSVLIKSTVSGTPVGFNV